MARFGLQQGLADFYLLERELCCDGMATGGFPGGEGQA